MSNELEGIRKELLELKEKLARRGVKIRELELRQIELEKDIKDIRTDFQMHNIEKHPM